MVEFYRMSGEVDYLLRVVVPAIAAYDAFYKRLISKIEIRDDVVGLRHGADQVYDRDAARLHGARQRVGVTRRPNQRISFASRRGAQYLGVGEFLRNVIADPTRAVLSGEAAGTRAPAPARAIDLADLRSAQLTAFFTKLRGSRECVSIEAGSDEGGVEVPSSGAPRPRPAWRRPCGGRIQQQRTLRRVHAGNGVSTKKSGERRQPPRNRNPPPRRSIARASASSGRR